jgi:hypothetical protein
VPDFTAVRDAALSIRQVLRESITLSDEPSLNGIEVDLRSPRELELDMVTDVVSLWTHRIDIQPDLVNQPPRRLAPGSEERRSLPVELVMYSTVMHDDAPTALLVTGRVLQTLYDHRLLRDPDLVGSLAATNSELTVVCETYTAYDANLVWSGLHTPQRLGAAFRVSGVRIDSRLSSIPVSRVLTSRATDSQIMEVV